jgi:hypothetical protein
LDPELKKAREAAKKELYETERKKSSKVLIPKYFMNFKFWSEQKEAGLLNSNEYKLLERLQV